MPTCRPAVPCLPPLPAAVTGLESQLTSAGVSVPPAPSAAAVASRGTNGSAQPATAEDYWSPVVHGELGREGAWGQDGCVACRLVWLPACCICMLFLY